MLQANPGLTPPLIKAILQYTAQPIAGASLGQQGAGLLKVEGAVRLAKSLRTDIASAIAAGTIRPGDNLLAPGQLLASSGSWIQSEYVGWSGLVTAGGSHLLSGPLLFQQFQGFYDPRLVWVRNSVQRITPGYWPNDTHV